MDCEEGKENGREWTVERRRKTGGNGLWRREGKREGIDCGEGKEKGREWTVKRGRKAGGNGL